MEHLYKVIRKQIDWKCNTPLPIGLFGDVHYDASSCDRERFAKFIHKCGDEKRFMFGMGDYHDFASTKERKLLQGGGLHETTMEHFDNLVQEKNREFCEQLKPVKDRLLGLIGGNHTWRLCNGYSSDEDLAQRMNTEYLGWLCVFALQVRLQPKVSQTVYFILCHGQGGGKLAGTSINKVDDLKRVFPFADVYGMGHDHQRGCWPTSTLVPVVNTDDFRIKEKRQYLVRSGSFMKSYEPDKSQYTTAMLCRPADLGGVRLNINFHRHHKTGVITTEIESIV